MKGWLLDTNVISEWRKPRQDRRVVATLSSQERKKLFTCVVCIAEIRKGVEEQRDVALANAILQWLDETLRPYFGERILDVSEDVCLRAMRIADTCERQRNRASVADVLIAAVAEAHDLVVVTRNVSDFAKTAVPILNPWTGERFNGA